MKQTETDVNQDERYHNEPMKQTETDVNQDERYHDEPMKQSETDVNKPFLFCPLKCDQKVSCESRKKSFDMFYSNGSWETQTAFLVGHIKYTEVYRRYGKGSPSKSRRQNTRYYYLNDNGMKKRVYKRMFMKTLCLDSARIHRALQKTASGSLSDQRGKQHSWNKLTYDQRECVKTHIKSFPKYKSHYSRRDTERDYLSPDLNLSKMYELYKIKCFEDEKEPVSKSTYEDIFYKEYIIFQES